ncbi:MAG TPA: PEP/pyruvate-binding domain-containing protein, partial [Marmoricola sp.]|nr:PEP/pyruvate-binding domain-containing protein [Marmoricola sp.]
MSANPTRFVFDFAEGNKDQKDLLGGKGANLAEMTNLGLPVPPGFIITTEACRSYFEQGGPPEGLVDEVLHHLAGVEQVLGKSLGHPDDPLLVAVRSGAKFSMPGMMETVLNVGLNDQTVSGLAAVTKNPRFAWDSYRRLLQMFGATVMDVDSSIFAAALEEQRRQQGVGTDQELTTPSLQQLVATYQGLIRQHAGRDFPQDPKEQLLQAVWAVFDSWNTDRARLYRRQEQIPEDLGTAVNVLAMVFGNLGADSG